MGDGFSALCLVVIYGAQYFGEFIEHLKMVTPFGRRLKLFFANDT